MILTVADPDAVFAKSSTRPGRHLSLSGGARSTVGGQDGWLTLTDIIGKIGREL